MGKLSKRILVICSIIILPIVIYSTFEGEPVEKSLAVDDESKESKDESGALIHDILLIYSHPSDTNSYISEINNDKEVNTIKLDATGIFDVNSKENGNLLLSSDMVNNKVEVEPNKLDVVRKDKTEYPLNLYISQPNLKVQGFNKDTQSNIVKITTDKDTWEYDFPPLVRNISFNDSFVFIFSDVIEEEKSVLYKIDRETGKEELINLKHNFASDMEIISNKVVITTEGNLTVYDIDNGEVSYIALDDVKNFDQIHQRNERVYISYMKNGKSGVMALEKDLKIISSKEFEFAHNISKFKHNNLYLNTTSDYGKNNTLRIVNLDNFKITDSFKLPVKDHKLQNLYVK
ncbi:hypothetical protein [Halobacillus sp. H74]|uniref:hypothetical protein n=1 Tax=Halobacillus sp. H74 TaxID=3457436 RepID=UPI003FCD6CAF